MEKYNKEDIIKDMERCIEQFKKFNLNILVDMKQNELNKIKKGNK